MSRKLAWLTLFAFSGVAAHAAPQAGIPTATGHSVLEVNRLESVVPAQLDLASLGEEDVMRDRLGLPPRYAVPERVSITPAKNGTWEDLGDGRMLWRLRVVGREGVTSINLGFTRFKMTPGARLLLYSTDGTQVARPFTADDNEAHGELWTPPVLTRDLIVELTVPKKEAKQVDLKLGWINQGYRGFGTMSAEDYNKSGSCNLDVECLPAGDTWRDEMRSVGVISTGGGTFCTGSLVNNTANDGKMYFITARHCGITSGNAASLVVFWNYQNSFCRTPGSAASGQPGDGTLNQFHTGSFFRASHTPSDVTLVELDDPAVPAFNHYWAGWDRTTGSFTCTAGQPCASIHHPSTDEKRITYVIVPMVPTSYQGTTTPGDGTHLWAKWATDPPGPFTVPGVTEPGSSGSPLYTDAGRFVGQLHGGPSACGSTGNNLSDYYGRFSVSWTGGGSSSTRLSNWLDAGNTGAMTLDGFNGGCTPPAAPTGLTATAVSQTQIDLSWGAVAGATQYRILRSTTLGGPYTQIGTSATTTFSDSGRTCGTTYYYVVRAFTACESGNSNEASATPACPVCTTKSFYSAGFEAATGMASWSKGTFVAGGSTIDWRGVQTCAANAGTKILRFGNNTCVTNYSNNNFTFAQANGIAGISIPAGAESPRLSFWHRRAFENGVDGATLTIALGSDPNYYTIPAAAIVSGASYNGTATAKAGCTLPAGSAGRPTFTGAQPTFVETVVDLNVACNQVPGNTNGCGGKTVRVAFTAISDCTVTDDGWFLDDVNVTACTIP